MKKALKLFLLFFACACQDSNYYQINGYAQGGTYSVKYKGADIGPAKLQVEIDNLLQEIEHCLSGYDKSSDISRFNAGDSIILSPMLADIYELSYKMWEESDGAFDVACAPLFDIWGFGFTSEQMPSKEKIDSCLKSCGTHSLKRPEEIHLLVGKKICNTDFSKNCTAVKLNFNAIAQGYSCDLVADLLHSHGVKDMLVDIGEIYCEGHNPMGRGWGIGIDNPVDGNNTPGADIKQTWNSEGRSVGIVTSGNYRKFYIKDGRKYSHTLDPRSGYPVEHSLLSATVVAPSAALADALATTFMVIGLEEAQRYLSAHPELEACLITENNVWTSW